MTTRYYNKVTGVEAVPGFHPIDPPDVVALPDTNPFFSELPSGQQLTFDIDGIPDGLEPIPPNPNQNLIDAIDNLLADGFNMLSLKRAIFLSVTGRDSQPLIDFNNAIIDEALNSGVTEQDLIAFYFGE